MGEKKRKKKPRSPRTKRMLRSGRLQSARAWLPTFSGENIAAGYRKRYGVDWPCAFKELEMLGVQIDPKYRETVLRSVQGQIEAKTRRREEQADDWDEDSDDYFAFIAGYTPGGAAFGVTWEEWESLELSGEGEAPPNRSLQRTRKKRGPLNSGR